MASSAHRLAFGKFFKPHPCNVKEFRVYGGLTPKTMTLLLHGGLKNDTNTETFELRTRNSSGVVCLGPWGSLTRQPFPCQYIKIEPMVAHSQNYNGPSLSPPRALLTVQSRYGQSSRRLTGSELPGISRRRATTTSG